MGLVCWSYGTSMQFTPQRYSWSLPPTFLKVSVNLFPIMNLVNNENDLRFKMVKIVFSLPSAHYKDSVGCSAAVVFNIE